MGNQTSRPAYKKRVHCKDNKTLSRNFVEPMDAILYANELLKAGHKAFILDYKSMSHVDAQARKYPDGPPGYRKR